MPKNSYTGIIDVYGGNSLNLSEAKASGINAVIHKASEGNTFKDQKYASRKKSALAQGFLWGAYHLTNGASPKKQLDLFLSVEPGADDSILMAIDWETAADGTILDLDGIREFVTLFHAKLGRYPVLYGGWTLRDNPEVVLGDPLLAQCPLWYQRYNWEPVALPVKTWPTYTLWQFADENRGYGAPPTSVCPGADFNRYQGTESDLRSFWPFSIARPAVAAPAPALPRSYEVTAVSLNLRKGASVNDDVRLILHLGDTVIAKDFNLDKTWVNVTTAGGISGWCSLRWLRPIVGIPVNGEPPWMKVARGEIGVKEVPGPGDNPRIVEYLRSTSLGQPDNQNDETYWCSAFVNWCMEEIGVEGTNSAWARDWLDWGKGIKAPVPGCVTVFSRGSGGHVGFYVEERDGLIYLLGGNQNDCVCIEGRDSGNLLGYRMNS